VYKMNMLQGNKRPLACFQIFIDDDDEEEQTV